MTVDHLLQILILAGESMLIGLYLVALFHYRKVIGLVPLFISLGTFQHIQVLLSLSIYVEILPGVVVSPGSVVLFTSGLFALLLVYTHEGEDAARKFIYAVVLSNAMAALLSFVFGQHLGSPLTKNFLHLSPKLFLQDVRVMLVGTIALYLDFLLIIILYEWLNRHFKQQLFFRMMAALSIILVFDTFVFVGGAFTSSPRFWDILVSGIIGKTLLSITYSVVLYCYLRYISRDAFAHATSTLSWGDLLARLTYVRNSTSEASEARFFLAVEGANDGLWDWHIDRDVMYLSSRWFEMLGEVSPSGFYPPSQWFDKVHPDDRESLQRQLTEHLNASSPLLYCEYRMQHAQGHWIWCLARGQAMEERSTKRWRIAGSQSDITERKRTEAMKDEFVSTVSHELRTPLTSLKGAVRILESGTMTTDSPGYDKLIKLAQRNSERLSSLINDLLDMQKISAGQLEYAFENTDALVLAKQALEENELYAHERTLTLQSTVKEGELWVHVDPDRLIQVLANLLSNAIKFSPPQEEVILSVSHDGQGIRYAVTDKGTGIPKEFQPHVFKKFRQETQKTNQKTPGTGLGLSICKAIVEAHGGEIGFDTEEGKGTTFHFLLPTKDQDNNKE